jgi:hypothetical protein
LRHDHRCRDLVEARIGNAEHTDLLDATRVAQCLLDLGRREILAANADDFLQPRDVDELAVGVIVPRSPERSQPSAVNAPRVASGRLK